MTRVLESDGCQEDEQGRAINNSQLQNKISFKTTIWFCLNLISPHCLFISSSNCIAESLTTVFVFTPPYPSTALFSFHKFTQLNVKLSPPSSDTHLYIVIWLPSYYFLLRLIHTTPDYLFGLLFHFCSKSNKTRHFPQPPPLSKPIPPSSSVSFRL